MLIYVVEDDDQQRDFFIKVLQANQHDVVPFKDTISAHNYFLSHSAPDAVLIDFRFEGGTNGLSLAGQIHAMRPTAAVLMTSCYADKEDIVDAFHKGIDDFLLKPVEPRKLVQSLGDAVIQRRTAHPVDSRERHLGELRIDPNTRQAWWHDQPLRLTHTEFTLLVQITARPGHVFNYAELYATCTGEHIDPCSASKKLKIHIHHLKQKFIAVEPAALVPIASRRGDGLYWATEAKE